MTELSQPNPDALLAEIQREAIASLRGNLKVFFGMCPGVGKTYAMLQAAQQQKRAGVDVLVGLVETHGRAETEALLADLPSLPRRELQHRGVVLHEFDLDAVLSRRPQLVLVDELAHTNAPGSRHPKRYQDVLELLDAGISVYTTVNIQHLESRVDVVRQITGIQVGETVPDSVLDRADDVQLIDLSPEQLRQRLTDGKVYLGDRAASAAGNFFREGNLTALREMALRYTAERVDRQVREFMRTRSIGGPWKSSERLLVGIGPSPFSEGLVRWTRRTAAAQNATWLAVFVETGATLSEEEKTRVTQNLALARQLGAEVMTVGDPHAAAGLLRVARENNVSQIVVGKPHLALWRRLLHGGDLVDDLLRHSGAIDLYVVRPDKTLPITPAAPLRLHLKPREYGMAALLIVAVTLIGLAARDWVGYPTISLFYLCAVVGSALTLGRGPVIASAGTSALLWNFLFVPPVHTFHTGTFHDAMLFATLLGVGLVMGQLTSRLRQREQFERERQRRTATLLQLTEHCTLEETLEAGLTAALRQIDDLFVSTTVLYLRDQRRNVSSEPHPASSWRPGDKEHGVAQWAYDHRQPAGANTTTLPQSAGLFLPLQTRTSTMGVLGLALPPSRILTLPERELLDACTSQIALALEKEHFREAFQRADLIEQSDKLRRTLLDNVSHELKTPVAAIRTALATLRREPPDALAQGMLREVEEASSRLERVVALLVDSARLETGMVQPRPEWCEVHDLISTAREICAPSLAGHPVSVHIADGAPLVQLDPQLAAQALAHVLNNAGTHTPPGTPIDILASVRDGGLAVRILDRGPGLPDTRRIFDKFHRGDTAKSGGLGLGLSIAKGLVLALHGEIEARNRDDGGAEFALKFPAPTREAIPL